MERYADLPMDPGPRDPSLLHLQSNHRSSLVWKACGSDAQRSRKRNPTQTRFPQLHSRMIPILEDLRFDGVTRLSSIHIDWSLITALVERWRSETHTFHLPLGECTITLQDVSLLLGLRVDGYAVTGSTHFVGGWTNLITQIFGDTPTSDELKGGRLQLSWLTSRFKSLPDDPSDEQLKRYTLSYILQLIAGVMFTDYSGGLIHCMYLPLIQDFSHCKTLAWGAAVLAYLFRELCKSCKIGVEENAGCILLLQLWAWSRLPTLAPIPRGPSLDDPFWGNRTGTYGMKWCGNLKFTDTSHVLSAHRLSLDALASSHFVWEPYTDKVLANLPEYLSECHSIWLYKGPLICFHIIEPHNPDRCLRQFGMIQDIPPADSYSKQLHDITLQGKESSGWQFVHRQHIEHWNNRGQNVISIGVNDRVGVVDGYYEWYTSVTRLYHTRIAGSHSYSLDLFDRIADIVIGKKQGTIEDILFIATEGRQVVKEQFHYGVFQDFPVDNEMQIKSKPKKAGHRGGRGGVNAPRKKKIHDDGHGDHCDNNEDFHLDEDDGYVGENLTTVHENQAGQKQLESTIVSTPGCAHPNWNLLPSGDFLRMSNTDVAPYEKDEVYNNPQIVVSTPIDSCPNWNLLPSGDFLRMSNTGAAPHEQQQHQYSHVQQPIQLPPQQPLHQPSNDPLQQPPEDSPPEHLVAQRQVDMRLEQPSQSPAQQPPEQPAQQQEVQKHMKLRVRKPGRGPCCGTTGRKELQAYKRRGIQKKK